MSPERISPSNFITVIEISKSGKKKCEPNKETGLIILDRILYTSTHYPTNYSFIPRAYGDGRDPLDVLMPCSEPLEPHTLVRCFLIDVIPMLDGGRNDERIAAIPFNDPTYSQYQGIGEPPTRIFDEMSHFFRAYRELENKGTAVKEVNGREETMRTIETTLDNYVGNFCK